MKELLLIAGLGVMLFAVSDVVWQDFIGAVQTIVMSLLGILLVYVQWRISKASKDISEVKADTKETAKKVDKQDEKLDVIHHLSNGVLGRTLESNKNHARWRADQTERPEDIAVADEAEKQYQEHAENEAKALAAKKAKPMEVVVVQPDGVPVLVEESP